MARRDNYYQKVSIVLVALELLFTGYDILLSVEIALLNLWSGGDYRLTIFDLIEHGEGNIPKRY